MSASDLATFAEVFVAVSTIALASVTYLSVRHLTLCARPRYS